MDKAHKKGTDAGGNAVDQSTALILFTFLGSGSDAVKKELAGQLPAEKWAVLVELAQQHGVAALLYNHLQLLKIDLPDDPAKELKQAIKQNTLRMMQFSQAMNGLLGLMNDHSIAVVVLKGAYLAEAVYKNIGLRMMGDIDLMVKNVDLERLDGLLLVSGWVPQENNRVVAKDSHHFRYRMPGSGLMVEIHWAIIDSSAPLRIDVEELWSRARPVTLAQAPALTLAPEDLLIHLCLHTAKHIYEMRMRMLCDIHEVIRHFGVELNWPEIGERARQWGAMRAVYVVLRLAQELLGSAVPADWLAALCPENFNDGYLDLAREQLFRQRSGVRGSLKPSRQLAVRLSQLWEAKGVGSKLALLQDRLLPSREMMGRLYPVPSHSWRIYLYYPVHIKNIFLRRGAALWRLAQGDSESLAAAEYTNRLKVLQDWLLSG